MSHKSAQPVGQTYSFCSRYNAEGFCPYSKKHTPLPMISMSAWYALAVPVSCPSPVQFVMFLWLPVTVQGLVFQCTARQVGSESCRVNVTDKHPHSQASPSFPSLVVIASSPGPTQKIEKGKRRKAG